MRTLKILFILSACSFVTLTNAWSDTLCVSKKAKVVNGKINLKKAIKRIEGECPKRFIELANTDEFVGATGPQGPAGPQGEAGPFVETLESGKTLRGVYYIGGYDDSPYDEISFQYPLGSAPQSHYINQGAAPPVECPGNANNPQANPGHFCVYERISINVASRGVIDFAGAPILADKHGAGIWHITDTSGVHAVTAGTWAVTAP